MHNYNIHKHVLLDLLSFSLIGERISQQAIAHSDKGSEVPTIERSYPSLGHESLTIY